MCSELLPTGSTSDQSDCQSTAIFGVAGIARAPPRLGETSPMPNPEPTSNDHPVPFRTCIRLEDVRHTRTSSIDAEWEALAIAPTQESTLPSVSARPRFETLPRLGPVSQPAAAPTPPRSRRSPLLVAVLAAALSMSLALLVAFIWRNELEVFAPPTLALGAQSNPIAATSEPSVSPLAAPAQPLAALVPTAVFPTAASETEPPPAKPAHKSKPAPRSMPPAARWAIEIPAPRLASANSFRAHPGALAGTDNPY